MSSLIHLPQLAVQPEQAPDPLSQYSKLQSIQALSAQRQQQQALMPGQLQMQQQQLEAGLLENKQRQVDVQDQQTMRDQAPNFVQKDSSGKVTGFDSDGYYNSLLANAVSPGKVAAARTQQATMVKTMADAGEASLKLQDAKNDNAYQILEGVRSIAKSPMAGPNTVQGAYTDAVGKLQQLGVDTSKFPQQYAQVGEGGLQQYEAQIGLHKQIVNDAKEQAVTGKDQADARNANAQASIKELETKGLQGITPDYISKVAHDPVTKNMAMAALQRGDVMGAQNALKAGFESALGTQKDINVATSEATSPAIQNAKVQLAARTKQADQVITQGGPVAAGKLLADGSLTLSELKSRGTTPDFIVQATNAAKQITPAYNPQRAEAELNVAKSPANLAFFGSAKSLTDPGGTLDQLKAAGKDIPDGKFPAWNSMADIYKAQTGSGPIAHYAATLIGVADDYAKVTGGGQGTEGMQKFIMSLAPAKASPEARDGAIDGFRGSVNSQVASRIGSNAVLKNMYGQNLPTNQAGNAAATPSGMVTMKAPNGMTKQVPAEQVEHYKSLGAAVVQQ
jgi:hypothetical protein